MRFTVRHEGDPARGVPPERATVDVAVEAYSEEVQGDYAQQIEDGLAGLFSSLWHAPVVVTRGPTPSIFAAGGVRRPL